MQEWQVRTYDWVALPEDLNPRSTSHFGYGGTWSQSLDRIAAGLPNLVDFRFDQGTSWASCGKKGTRYDFEHRYSCGARVFPQRYVCFDSGILPTRWPEACEEGELHSWLDDGWPNVVHLDSLQEDQKSLDRLLDVCRLTGLKS